MRICSLKIELDNDWRAVETSFLFFTVTFYRYKIILHKNSVSSRTKRITSEVFFLWLLVIGQTICWGSYPVAFFWGIQLDGTQKDNTGKGYVEGK